MYIHLFILRWNTTLLLIIAAHQVYNVNYTQELVLLLACMPIRLLDELVNPSISENVVFTWYELDAVTRRWGGFFAGSLGPVSRLFSTEKCQGMNHMMCTLPVMCKYTSTQWAPRHGTCTRASVHSMGSAKFVISQCCAYVFCSCVRMDVLYVCMYAYVCNYMCTYIGRYVHSYVHMCVIHIHTYAFTSAS